MIYTIDDSQMADWKDICKAFARREHAELVFVNNTGMGIEYPNGTMRHIYVDELYQILESEVI